MKTVLHQPKNTVNLSPGELFSKLFVQKTMEILFFYFIIIVAAQTNGKFIDPAYND